MSFDNAKDSKLRPQLGHPSKPSANVLIVLIAFSVPIRQRVSVLRATGLYVLILPRKSTAVVLKILDLNTTLAHLKGEVITTALPVEMSLSFHQAT